MNGRSTSHRTRSAWQLVAIALPAIIVLLLASVSAASTTTQRRGVIAIATLSSRADLIIGGGVLVRVDLPPGTRPRAVRITLDGRDVSSAFAVRSGGAFEGLITGLRLGRNVVKALRRDGSGATLAITDHPISGPLFSGPRIEPWSCDPGAADAFCDHPGEYSLYYYSTDPATCAQASTLPPYNEGGIPSTKGAAPCFAPYSRQVSQASIPRVTTDRGVKVTFIVRVEKPWQDRDQVRVAVLYRPGSLGSSHGPRGRRGTIGWRSRRAEPAGATTAKHRAKCHPRWCRTRRRA